MKSLFIIFILLIILFEQPVQAQIQPTRVRVMFWNLENYFDPFDDSLTVDEDFTPRGNMHWTWKKFVVKRNNIYKVLAAAGDPEPPAIIGFAEVENRFVLYELLRKTPLLRYDYAVVHNESPDSRGIDAALLYRKDLLKLIDQRFYKLEKAGEETFRTREIVYARMMVAEDTLHVLVNHWPSRSGGQTESDGRRCAAGHLLKSIVDSIQQQSPHAKILAMGDFNDTPLDASLLKCLGTVNELPVPPEAGDSSAGSTQPVRGLVNLSGIWLKEHRDEGTHKFQGDWAVLDQVLVTPEILLSDCGVITTATDFHVFRPAFLLVPDKPNLGVKPNRTFNGMRYQGGYSDHLPVILDLNSVPSPGPGLSCN